jgi:hypothetical protein
LEELEAIDGLASRAGLGKGRLEMVGLRIIPSALGNPSLGGIPEDELPEVKRTLSALRHISVNGCFASVQGRRKTWEGAWGMLPGFLRTGQTSLRVSSRHHGVHRHLWRGGGHPQ